MGLFGKGGGAASSGGSGGGWKNPSSYILNPGGSMDVAATTREQSANAGADPNSYSDFGDMKANGMGSAFADLAKQRDMAAAKAKDEAGGALMKGLMAPAMGVMGGMGQKSALKMFDKMSQNQNGGAKQFVQGQPEDKTTSIGNTDYESYAPEKMGPEIDAAPAAPVAPAAPAIGGGGMERFDMSQTPTFDVPAGGVGSITSDKKAKNGGVDGLADRAVEQFLNKLDPKLYTYKQPGFSPDPNDFDKPQLGILAQDVEKTPVGKSLIDKDPNNGLLSVKIVPMVSALAASVAHLNKKLEGRG